MISVSKDWKGTPPKGYKMRGSYDKNTKEWTFYMVKDTLNAATVQELQGLMAEIDSERSVGDNVRNKSENQTVTYRRVQGGTPPKASWVRIIVDARGRIIINKKTADLNISVDNGEHANYFRNRRGNNTHTVAWQVPKWFDDLLRDNAVDQYKYRTNPKNQGGVAPKIVDKGTPGLSYELSNPWLDWLEEYGMNGRIEKQKEFK